MIRGGELLAGEFSRPKVADSCLRINPQFFEKRDGLDEKPIVQKSTPSTGPRRESRYKNGIPTRAGCEFSLDTTSQDGNNRLMQLRLILN
jgi:hypothetical protein